MLCSLLPETFGHILHLPPPAWAVRHHVLRVKFVEMGRVRVVSKSEDHRECKRDRVRRVC